MPGLKSFFLLLALLCGCAAPASSSSSNPFSTAVFTPLPSTTTPTEAVTEPATATPTPMIDASIKTILDSQKAAYSVSPDGKITIDPYDNPAVENINLVSKTIKVINTTDGLNLNILTAQDSEGNTYAFNPDHGWFKVLEAQKNYADLSKYTEVDQAFIEDGRANIATSYLYTKYNQEHTDTPLISPNAVNPVYWVVYNNFKNVLALSLRTVGDAAIAWKNFPDLFNKSEYKENNKPFALTGFYKVHLKTGEYIYVIGRTLKNPSATNKNQTINLFNGYDQKIWENMANNMLPSGITELKMVIDGVNKGGFDFTIILPPPDQITDENGQTFSPPYDPSTVNLLDEGPSPDVGKLQQRGVIISFFSQADQKNILDVLLKGVKNKVVVSSIDHLSDSLPYQLSKSILQTTVDTP